MASTLSVMIKFILCMYIYPHCFICLMYVYFMYMPSWPKKTKKLQWNINRNSYIFIQENALENVVCEMTSILSLPQCAKGYGDTFGVPNNSLCLLIYFDIFAGLHTLYLGLHTWLNLCPVLAYSLVRACMLDSKGVGWHQAPGWFHLKCIINWFKERIWCLNCLWDFSFFFLTGLASFKVILIKLF